MKIIFIYIKWSSSPVQFFKWLAILLTTILKQDIYVWFSNNKTNLDRFNGEFSFKYSGDPKTGNIRKPDIFSSGFLIAIHSHSKTNDLSGF
jgi:hypothetical protein